MIDAKKLALIAGVLLMLSPVPGSAQSNDDTQSANFLLPYCREWMKGEKTMLSGVCVGSVGTMASMAGILEPGFRFCPPKGGSRDQAVAVVVKFLEAHPEQWHEHFSTLALAAMKQAWPCR